MKHKYFDNLPKEVHYLSDNESIFTVPGVHLVKETYYSNRSSASYTCIRIAFLSVE